MKIAIIGDLHLGYKQYGLDDREQDFYDRWGQIIEDIISRQNIDMVLQLGDIFDNHIPSGIALYAYEKQLDKLLQYNIPYYSITGNHTLIRKQHFMSPDELFTHLLDIQSLDDKNIIINNVFIAGVKYRSESKKEELVDEINRQAEAAQQHNGLKILLLHQAVDVDLLYGAELSEQDLPTHIFDYIFIGHLHSRIERKHGNCLIIYPGSIERSNTTEARDENNRGKGFVILDTDNNSYEVINIPCSRRFIFMNVSKETDMEMVREKIRGYSHKPIVELNFKAIDVHKAHEIGHIIADDCLRLSINVANEQESDDDEELLVDKSISSIQNMLEERMSKKQAVFAYEMLEIFNKNKTSSDNIDSAIALSDDFFKENY